MQEAEVFKQLVMSDTAKALVHVFFAQRATSKVRLSKPFNPPKAIVSLGLNCTAFVAPSTSCFHV